MSVTRLLCVASVNLCWSFRWITAAVRAEEDRLLKLQRIRSQRHILHVYHSAMNKVCGLWPLLLIFRTVFVWATHGEDRGSTAKAWGFTCHITAFVLIHQNIFAPIVTVYIPLCKPTVCGLDSTWYTVHLEATRGQKKSFTNIVLLCVCVYIFIYSYFEPWNYWWHTSTEQRIWIVKAQK